MLISHSKKFLFFHLYKAAGSSLVQALSPFCESRTSNPHFKPSEALGDPGFSELYKDYFTFSFVRNPWDWQVSLYEYMRCTPNHPQHQLCMEKSFHDYILWRVNNERKTQFSFLSDEANDSSPLSLDFIGKVENIQQDFNNLRLRFGIDTELPHINKSSRKGAYQDYYNPETADLIREAFKLDIETFNYHF